MAIGTVHFDCNLCGEQQVDSTEITLIANCYSCDETENVLPKFSIQCDCPTCDGRLISPIPFEVAKKLLMLELQDRVVVTKDNVPRSRIVSLEPYGDFVSDYATILADVEYLNSANRPEIGELDKPSKVPNGLDFVLEKTVEEFRREIGDSVMPDMKRLKAQNRSQAWSIGIEAIWRNSQGS